MISDRFFNDDTVRSAQNGDGCSVLHDVLSSSRDISPLAVYTSLRQIETANNADISRGLNVPQLIAPVLTSDGEKHSVSLLSAARKSDQPVALLHLEFDSSQANAVTKLVCRPGSGDSR